MKLKPELLMMPRIPKPLHGIAPRTVLGTAWWDTARHAAYTRARFCCEACGVPKEKAAIHRWLEAHERYEIDYERGRMVFVGLVALCHLCHNFIHMGRLRALLEEGSITPASFELVKEHGVRVLQAAGLTRPEEPTVQAPWSCWRMVYEGREYGPSSKDEAAWSRGEWRNWKP